jgi:hypothetical protein
MNHRSVIKELSKISKTPKSRSEEFKKWLEQTEFLEFLVHTRSNEIPIYITNQHIFLYSVFLPLSNLQGDYIDDLIKWNFTSNNTWGIDQSFGPKHEKKLKISAPFEYYQASRLSKAEPIIFIRSFSGKITNQTYIELNQKFAHINDLHYLEEKNNYSLLNEGGDIEEIVRITKSEDCTLVTIKQQYIDEYLYLSESVLLRLFDRTLFFGTSEASRKVEKLGNQKYEIYASRGTVLDKYKNPIHSWLRGFQIIRNQMSDDEIYDEFTRLSPKSKQYEKFIALDWKNNEVKEFTCDPKELSNYFEQSDKPFEISPAFFKPEVLLKYKQDPEKYTLNDIFLTLNKFIGNNLMNSQKHLFRKELIVKILKVIPMIRTVL